MSVRRNSEIGAEERAEIFHEAFDIEIDAGATLVELVKEAGGYLGMIVGGEAANAGMAQMVEPLVGRDLEPGDWREALDDAESQAFSDWPMGQRLHDLAAYAHFGIALGDGEDAESNAVWVETLVEEARRFRDRSPLAQWLGSDRAPQLERLVNLAEARWALDNNQPVEPSAVAAFGGIGAPRMRNLMAGPKRVFTRDGEGRIPAHEALAWLADRETFWNSIWRDQPLPTHRMRRRPPLAAPVFVPVARDGSVFHPGLKRNGAFTVGDAGGETHVADFDEALRALHAMSEPFWRRPNEKGAWGRVRGVRWERVERRELNGYAANPAQRLALTG